MFKLKTFEQIMLKFSPFYFLCSRAYCFYIQRGFGLQESNLRNFDSVYDQLFGLRETFHQSLKVRKGLKMAVQRQRGFRADSNAVSC